MHLSDDIIKTRAKSSTSHNCCFYVFRFIVYLLSRTSTMHPRKIRILALKIMNINSIQKKFKSPFPTLFVIVSLFILHMVQRTNFSFYYSVPMQSSTKEYQDYREVSIRNTTSSSYNINS